MNNELGRYLDYYAAQAEGRGVGGSFKGYKLQRGNGVGSFIANLFRKILPYVKNGAAALGSELLNTGVGVLRDTLNGADVKNSIKERVTTAGTNLGGKASTQIQNAMELMVGELDIFAPTLIQTSVLSGDWQNYQPVQAITKDGPIQFFVPGQGSNYFDLNKTLLYVRFKVTDSVTSDKLDATAEFSLKNNVLNTMFSDVKLEFNQMAVSNSNHMNHYRSYFELLYNFNATAKKTHLTSALFYQDTAGAFNDLTSEPNKKRKSFVTGGKEVEVIGKLHCDMLAVGKYLINDVDLRVTLTRNPASMVLLTGKDSKIVPQIDIQEAVLYVRKVNINPGILVAHAKTLETAVARYNYKRVEMLNFTISSGLHQKCLDNLFLNRIPSRIIFGLVKNSAFSGSYTESPFNFEHFDMNYIALSVNGQTVGAAPYKPNFEGGKSILPYLFSFYGVGIHMTDDGFEVDREDFDKGYALYCYDLTGDLSSCESHVSVENQGSCRLELGFAKPLPCVVNLIVYAEFPDCIEIDRSRSVHIQFKK
ncbi:uncharacterized protein LOC132205790 [Neocloeon triangulifer]|uniref:uncharacterized protein LOC132205790 n=1 Tax=Neocloeon triangulifer TaxID=2078957 RepID=UPI00286F6ADE|nr:uncharacterized protein LOC132205790 [Neocloeon triangulifer]